MEAAGDKSCSNAVEGTGTSAPPPPCCPAPQVAAAKIAVDLETDDAGRLTSDQARSYAASMRHEYSIYEGLLQAGGGSYGIPEVYFAGGLACPCTWWRGNCPPVTHEPSTHLPGLHATT